MDPLAAMEVDQDAGPIAVSNVSYVLYNPNQCEIFKPSPEKTSALPLDNNTQNEIPTPETQAQNTATSDVMEVDQAAQMRTEKRKRTTTNELERGRVRIVESEKHKSLVKRLEAEISELKQANSNLENEIDDVNYQLKTEISDLKRANSSFRDELINLRAVDVSLVGDINSSSWTPRESEKLIPLITKLQVHIKHLEDPSRYVPANFEPSNEVEKNLITRVNQLQILHDTALKQQKAFLESMKNAQRDKEAFHQQAIGLQETNTRVQNELRQLQARVSNCPFQNSPINSLQQTQRTPDEQVQDLQNRIKQLLVSFFLFSSQRV
ncbi:hypothetical protein VKT23_016152 [Stygiomarasmius scandens]|uniref:Uncharacterized protein n=1 Tax=Marasmiellus scandens TaxID=2682957 RepID=A0ABR1IY66_9AGAR